MLEMNKKVMHELWHYVKTTCKEKVKLYRMDTCYIFYSLHKNRRHLHKHCKKCGNKI